MLKVVEIQRAGPGSDTPPAATAVLAHDERHLRRKAIALTDGRKALIDLPEPTVLHDGDRLVLEDGGVVLIEAAPEALFEVRGHDGVHLTQLAWHIGNRHLPAEIGADRILILRDHVIRSMLEGLGATVTDVTGPFTPTRGAYAGSGHGHGHSHGHGHGHGQDHDHGPHHHG